ncbi:MAG: protoporphyrinogen oxidase [Deltaproteobacteria bacterium]|nr:protoporphyrinogen oxidase [Deltaproteobacteria bacterium]
MSHEVHDIIIIGAGLTGLALAHYLKKQNAGLDILVLDKSHRPGGAIRTHQEAGFIAEYGAHGFLDNTEEGRDLINKLHLESEILRAPLKKFVRYLCLDGKLQMIPQTPQKIIISGIMPLRHKLRVAADLFKKPIEQEQTVAAWTAHRFGKGMLPFADAVFTGTYAGDIHKLSIDATMPGVRGLEKQAGSVIRGALKLRKNKKGTPFPCMISFKQGMEQIITSLLQHQNIRYGVQVTGIRPTTAGFEITTPSAKMTSLKIAVALHINQAIPLLQPLAAPPFPSIPEAGLANVVMGFDKSAEIPFGFGYLAPAKEQRFALGAIFSSHMFPKRAPEGHSLIEVLVGGRRYPERLELDDNALIHEAYSDIRTLIHLPNQPVFATVLRTKTGIPQLETGYQKILDWRQAIETRHHHLKILGFGWEGIGINDMIKKAKSVSLEWLQAQTGHKPPEARAVYF